MNCVRHGSSTTFETSLTRSIKSLPVPIAAFKLSDFILFLFFKLSYLSLENRRRTTICNSHKN